MSVIIPYEKFEKYVDWEDIVKLLPPEKVVLLTQEVGEGGEGGIISGMQFVQDPLTNMEHAFQYNKPYKKYIFIQPYRHSNNQEYSKVSFQFATHTDFIYYNLDKQLAIDFAKKNKIEWEELAIDVAKKNKSEWAWTPFFELVE